MSDFHRQPLEETERRLRLSLETERQLLIESQEQQQRLDVSLRAAGMGTFEYDVATRRVKFDERTASVIGVDDDASTIEPLVDLVHPNDRADLITTLRSSLRTRLPADAVVRINRADDRTSVRWIHGWLQPIEGDDGTVRKIVGLLQDVTAERERRRVIEEREQRLQLVLDVTVTGVFDWDLDRQEIVFSENWYRTTGLDPADIDTRHWDWQRLVHPDDWPDTAGLLAAQLDGSSPGFTHDLRLRGADAAWRWARLASRVVERDAHGRARRVIGADTDISAQRSLEQQLVHSAKMQALGEFAGGIAHDFNNVMAIVRGHTEFLQRASTDPDSDRRLASIEHAVDRASSLVRDLMLLGRPATDNPVVVDLRELIGAAATSWPAFLGDDVVLELDLADDVVPVRIDVSRLDAMLLNIVANSHDAMPEGGTLRVVLRRRSVDGNDVAELRMSDDGVGMDTAMLRPIFEPFFTTKAPGVGTGLGLATSYTTVTQAGGTIVADSEVGVGTTMTITLPIATPVGAASGDDARPTGLAGVRGASILVVEDEPEILELNADILRLAGHRVYEALDAEEALEILHGGASVDLLLTDAVMPGMSGPRLADVVRSRWPQIRVLYLSGYAASTRATDAIDPTRLLTKPVAAEDLVLAVSDALRRPA